MSDDLASFFAKKKNKASKKKAIRLDEVAHQLESNLKFQNENEDIVSQKSDRDQDPVADDDPEWLQFDSKPTIQTQAVGVGVFNYTEETMENEAEDEREERTTERVKTWAKSNVVESKDDVPSTPATPTAPTANKPAAYRPPGARGPVETMGTARRQAVNKVDIKSEELFPSLGDADRIVKEEKARVDEIRRQQAEEAAANAKAAADKLEREQSAPNVPPAPTSEKPTIQKTQQPIKSNDNSAADQPAQTPPPPVPQPNVYQPPSQPQRTQQQPEPQRQQPPPPTSRPEPTGNQPYLPAHLRGEQVDRNTLRSRLNERQQPGFGAGVRNAKGEEIRYNNTSAPQPQQPEVQRQKPEPMSWRRRDPDPPTNTHSPPPPDPKSKNTYNAAPVDEQKPSNVREQPSENVGGDWQTVHRRPHREETTPSNWRSNPPTTQQPQQRRVPPTTNAGKYVAPQRRNN
ncbi:hypothetical protein M3Y94_00450000 [Aphelenchoides besseyi]|nr:hypothetical protein M3Y94_00450000 [Aphelenchoides besseyi]KAI6229312.1 hypothetical protein M3Y95_00517900 [Aphelenchoides besseyi]